MNANNKKTKIQFPDEFFKEEIRCDYVVTEEMKKIWAIEIDLLNELLKVCKKHDIKVIVYAGTLLGAIRHKGMIPWDDDVDVALTRVEYEKLCKIAPMEFKHPYFFQNYKTDPQYLFGFSRLRNSLTTGHIVGYDNTHYNNGIFIDIFVLDGLIDNTKLLKSQLRSLNYTLKIANLYKMNSFTTNPTKRMVKKAVMPIISFIMKKFVSYDKITRTYDHILQRYNYTTSNISLITHPYSFAVKYCCESYDFDRIIYVPFENINVPVPLNYDIMLNRIYGNYMEYPPLKERGKWHNGQIQFDPNIEYSKR